MIEAHEAKKYLEIVRDLRKSNTFFDMHVHPYEVIFRQCNYSPNSSYDGLYSTNSSDFFSPYVTDITLSRPEERRKAFDLFLRPECLKKKICRLYAHTGPRAFIEQMELSGVDKVLLLPVAPPNGGADSQISAMKTMFGGDERFYFAWSPPKTIEEDILTLAKRAISLFSIRAVKVHPNVTEIDLTSSTERQRLETIVEVSGKLQLPLIVHGGRSPLLPNQKASSWASLRNLKHINWGLSSAPVVIAHAGSYGYNLKEIEDETLPTLETMLSTYDNLMVDLSGLHIEALILCLKKIDTNRIVFGSDALYEQQWASIVKLLIAIKKTTRYFEHVFVQIASTTPSKTIFV